jgi:hypothetical protein
MALDIGDGESREFHAWILYDWETKTKRFFNHNEKGPGSIGEFYNQWKAERKPSEHLYQFQLKVRRDGNPEFQLAHVTYFKEDWITRRRPEADESEFKYTAKRLLGMVQEALPPDCFGPEKGPFQSTYGGASEDQVFGFFTIPTMSFEVSVKRLTRGRQPAVVQQPVADPSKGRQLTPEARQHLWNSLYASAVAERTQAMYATRWAARDAKKLAWSEVVQRENDGGGIHEEASSFADEALKTFDAQEAENA